MTPADKAALLALAGSLDQATASLDEALRELAGLLPSLPEPYGIAAQRSLTLARSLVVRGLECLAEPIGRALVETQTEEQ